MNLNQLKYIAIQSELLLSNKKSIYGISKISDIKNLFVLLIIIDILDQSDWYSLNTSYIKSLYETASEIIRDSSYMLFEVPTNDIYGNINNPQTSFTYDNIN